MGVNRRQQRIWTLQALFEVNFREINGEEALDNLLEREPEANKADYAQKLLPLIVDNLEEIDAKIEEHSKGWKIKRMANVDLSILRMAVGEMLYLDEIVDSVAINEALEIAREYSSEKSVKFINGILGALSRQLENE